MKTCFSIAKAVTEADLKEIVSILKSYFPNSPSTLNDLKAIYKASPRSVIILKDYANNGLVVGGMLVLSVTSSFFKDFCKGKASVHNWRDCLGSIVSFDSKIVHNVIMESIVVRKEYRNTEAWLIIMEYFMAFVDFLMRDEKLILGVASESESEDGDNFFGKIMNMEKAFKEGERTIFVSTMDCIREIFQKNLGIVSTL
ncbi:MAG: hypothetical protein PHS16_01670 [Candidatus Colwellbacteria bacterium]|jgi:hypothetical protein|nr:hypothetical protein [Candidatus Colwellbacteria bacterium]MCK9497271.1 hypothetical protein [Candidatus Colwellbacteria bacterium]MDD3752628.1 hypothetical protein [Candidatus Colwellbacteria bacterium]MDD4818703.1 hypothetical protein [Candidatus Colwellbacteria bacterium]